MDMLLFVGLSNQKALRRQMDVIANNIANMNSNAYKGERVRFQDYMMSMKAGNDLPKSAARVDFVLDYGIFRSTEDGALIQTSNPLDIALQGQGYFSVEMENGQTGYSRNGKLTIDDRGQLTTTAGNPVLDAGRRPIVIALGDEDISISAEGTISSRNGPIGQLDLVQFPPGQDLERVGNSLVVAKDGTEPLPAEGLKVVQGSLESSNINPIAEVNEMIKVTRAYQSMQRNIDRIHELRNQSIERLSRVQ